MANENGIGQTESPWETLERCGVWTLVALVREVEVVLERRTIEGESPVYEPDMAMKWILSSVRWISRVNVGGRDFQS